MSLSVKTGLSPTAIALIQSGDYPVKIKLTNSLGIVYDFTVTFTVKVAKALVTEEIKPAANPAPSTNSTDEIIKESIQPTKNESMPETLVSEAE